MAANIRIEWTDVTWNPVAGCTPVSPGCLNCYAARDAVRMAGNPNPKISGRYKGLAVVRDGRPVFNGTVRLHEDRLSDPLRWRKPRMVFVNSQSDLFHEDVPLEFIDRVFAAMAVCPQHKFQVLTKRPKRMAEYLSSRRIGTTEWTDNIGHEIERLGKWTTAAWDAAEERASRGVLPNVWLGASAEDQQRLDERLPHLLRVPAAARFLSLEPLLGPIGLSCCIPIGIDWVIVGGESGPRARPCKVAWIRDIARQCRAAGVPCFVKQVGALPLLACSQCGREIGKVLGGLVDACSPTHAAMIAEAQRIRHPKGGDPSEWPAELRVREWPT